MFTRNEGLRLLSVKTRLKLGIQTDVCKADFTSLREKPPKFRFFYSLWKLRGFSRELNSAAFLVLAIPQASRVFRMFEGRSILTRVPHRGYFLRRVSRKASSPSLEVHFFPPLSPSPVTYECTNRSKDGRNQYSTYLEDAQKKKILENRPDRPIRPDKACTIRRVYNVRATCAREDVIMKERKKREQTNR